MPGRSDWFTNLFGFQEPRGENVLAEVQGLLEVVTDDKGLQALRVRDSKDKSYQVGRFRTPSLSELRRETEQIMKGCSGQSQLTIELKYGDVAQHQADGENKFAVFQAASQFNCLEFASYRVTPEDGVTGYVWDRTQGPACSISAGPATVYRNYFHEFKDSEGKVVQTGQSIDRQINNLEDLLSADVLREEKKVVGYITVRNGYTLAQDDELRLLNAKLNALNEQQTDALGARLRIGVHEDVQVTSSNWGRREIFDQKHIITQVFGSACAVAYSRNASALWSKFAKLVLDASYEATLLTALANRERHEGKHGSDKVFLTALGGGVFGNDMKWIADAIFKACDKFRGTGLKVFIVQYCRPDDRDITSMISRFNASSKIQE